MIAIILNTLKTFRILLLVHIKWRNYVIGKNPFIGRHVHIWAKNSIIIGKNFYIGKFSSSMKNLDFFAKVPHEHYRVKSEFQ